MRRMAIFVGSIAHADHSADLCTAAPCEINIAPAYVVSNTASSGIAVARPGDCKK